MTFNRSIKNSILILLAVSALTVSSAAHAEGYFGLELGLGVPAGTAFSQDSGFVYGGTAGYRLTPDLGLAITYQHDGLKFTNSGVSISENLLLAEANFFTLFFLASGVHLGSVTTNIAGISSTDLGVGVHTGLDIKVNNEISVGAALYWTYVPATNDNHSLFNFVVPVKYWF